MQMAKYEPIPTEEGAEELAVRPLSSYRKLVRTWMPWVCHALLLSLSLTIFLATLRERSRLLDAKESPKHSFDEENVYC